VSNVPLPPLSSIKDPAIRAVFQAIYQELQIRRGEIGSGGEKFVTKTELDSAVKKP
jgi:hypothetical protein